MADDTIDAAAMVHGLQSVGMTTNFNLEQAFQLGQLEIYENIEEVATKNSIPILAIVIKQTIQEAITLMSENIAKQAKPVRNQVYEMIEENSKSGQTVMIVGVGNTLGISQ